MGKQSIDIFEGKKLENISMETSIKKMISIFRPSHNFMDNFVNLNERNNIWIILYLILTRIH